MSIICVFGDSTSWGAWDLEKGGWVNRLWLDCANNNQDLQIYNCSVDGGDTKTILERFEKESEIRDADVVIIQSGDNDAAYDKTTNINIVPIDKFAENLREIIRKAKALNLKVFVMGGAKYIESKTTPVPWCNLCYTNDCYEKYNNVIKDIAKETDCIFINLFDVIEVEDLYIDGLHYNSSGHQKIFELVKEALKY